MVQLPDGRLVTGSGDKDLRIWELNHYSCSAVLTGHSGAVRCIVVLENGELLATGADDNNVIIWCVDLTYLTLPYPTLPLF
jgi:WD40 repeat protein